MLSSGLMAGAVEAFRRRAGGWPGGLSEGRECRALAADSPYRFLWAQCNLHRIKISNNSDRVYIYKKTDLKISFWVGFLSMSIIY